MKILAVDASAVSASAAIVEDKKILGEFYLNVGLTHSCTLMPMIESLLKYAQISISDIDLFAVTNGPGSFTGIRIGVATVKGMAEPLSKPCAGVSTLLAMAQNLKGQDGIICSVMDARCKQVYTACFECVNGKIVRLTPDDAISIDALCEILRKFDRKVTFVGDGANLCYNLLKETLPDVYIAPEMIRYQHASGAAMAIMDDENKEIPSVTADLLSVSYLRLSQAERERKQKMEAKL